MSSMETSSAPEIKGYILRKWGRLSESEVECFERNRDKFYEYVEEHYFQPRSKVERQIRKWERYLEQSAA